MLWNIPSWLGIAAPVFLIASIGYGGHIFVFSRHLSRSEQIWFQVKLSFVWLSYILAIFKDPGSPPKDYKPLDGAWRRWCKKCSAYKPERTHHCKTCKKCVKQMDHHCPWITNCVGHDNMPHFLRFLLWVDYTNGYAFVKLFSRLYSYWIDRDLPIYLISKVELTAVIILVPMSLFVMITVGIMTGRCLYSILFTGMTQIESWEFERLESQTTSARFWEKFQKNYFLRYGKESKSVAAWSSSHRIVKDDEDEDEAPPFFGIDDVVFPYDINPWRNLVLEFGNPWSWLLPWGQSLGDGVTFEKNDFVDTTGEDELNSLPWPLDSGDDDKELVVASITDDDKELVIPSSSDSLLDQTTDNGKGVHWSNGYGEKLSDFGVDIDAE